MDGVKMESSKVAISSDARMMLDCCVLPRCPPRVGMFIPISHVAGHSSWILRLVARNTEACFMPRAGRNTGELGGYRQSLINTPYPFLDGPTSPESSKSPLSESETSLPTRAGQGRPRPLMNQ